METYPATITIYVPKGSADNVKALRALEHSLRDRGYGEEDLARLHAIYEEGGTIVIRDSEACYGSPHGVAADELAFDYDHHIEPEYQYDIETVFQRAGKVTHRFADRSGDLLISKGDLQRWLENARADERTLLARDLLGLFEAPTTGYPVGPLRFETDWDGSILETAGAAGPMDSTEGSAD